LSTSLLLYASSSSRSAHNKTPPLGHRNAAISVMPSGLLSRSRLGFGCGIMCGIGFGGALIIDAPLRKVHTSVCFQGDRLWITIVIFGRKTSTKVDLTRRNESCTYIYVLSRERVHPFDKRRVERPVVYSVVGTLFAKSAQRMAATQDCAGVKGGPPAVPEELVITLAEPSLSER
jgi:hypothetical protein